MTILAVAGVVIVNEQILLALRNTGVWAPPGGKVEPGETLSEALRREMWEETSLLVTPYAVATVVELRAPDRDYLIFDFLCTAENLGSLQAGSDAQAICWASISRPDALSLAPGVHTMLEMLRKRLELSG